MYDNWIALTMFVSTSLLTISTGTLLYDWLFRYRMEVAERIRNLSLDDRSGQSVSLFKDLRRLHVREVINSQTWAEWTLEQMELAGLRCSLRTFALVCIGSSLLAALVGGLWSWWLGALLGMAGVAAPFWFLSLGKRRRRAKLSRQLPEAFSMISRAVKAGQTVPSALQIVAEDFEPPISTEFARCYEEQNLGIGRETALRQLAKRTGIMELQIFVVALVVQAKSGGDLVELLDNLSAMVRKRLKLADRVRALTGEGRMQALVLTVLPIAALAGIMMISPEYAKSLIDRPWLLAGTVAAQALGVFWIRRIVAFEY